MRDLAIMKCFIPMHFFFCIAVTMITFFQHNTTVQSVLVDSALRHAVRYSDDGLFATTLNAYEKEWNETFISGYEQKTLSLMTTSSPISFWFRCVNRQLRGYFFIESLAKEPDMYFNILAYGPDGILPRLKIFADGQPVTYGVGHGGGEFYVDVSSKPWYSEVIFTVSNWVRFTSFPISKCIDLPSQPHNGEEPVYMIHAHTYDHPAAIKQNSLLPSGVAHHLMYHRCTLNITKYELIIQPEDLSLYMKNHLLHHLARAGALTFVLKSAHPSRLNLPYFSCHHQAIYENQALLRHWKSNVRIFFLNPDEYLSFTPSLNLTEFKRQYLSSSNVAFDRYMTFCYDCKVGEPELPFMSFANRRYKLSSKLNDPKLFIDPDRNGCMLVHWSHCGTPCTLLSNDTAHILHFENLYNQRWTNDSSVPFVSKMFYHTDPDIDSSRMSLLKCDPGKLLQDLKNTKMRNKYTKHTKPNQ